METEMIIGGVKFGQPEISLVLGCVLLMLGSVMAIYVAVCVRKSTNVKDEAPAKKAKSARTMSVTIASKVEVASVVMEESESDEQSVVEKSVAKKVKASVRSAKSPVRSSSRGKRSPSPAPVAAPASSRAARSRTPAKAAETPSRKSAAKSSSSASALGALASPDGRRSARLVIKK